MKYNPSARCKATVESFLKTAAVAPAKVRKNYSAVDVPVSWMTPTGKAKKINLRVEIIDAIEGRGITTLWLSSILSSDKHTFDDSLWLASSVVRRSLVPVAEAIRKAVKKAIKESGAAAIVRRRALRGEENVLAAALLECARAGVPRERMLALLDVRHSSEKDLAFCVLNAITTGVKPDRMLELLDEALVKDVQEA